jgi:hypothetical protein
VRSLGTIKDSTRQAHGFTFYTCTTPHGVGRRRHHGGQVIGKTDKKGAAIEEGPISALGFLATACDILGIDASKQNTSPGGRPVRIVDKGATPIKDLLA